MLGVAATPSIRSFIKANLQLSIITLLVACNSTSTKNDASNKPAPAADMTEKNHYYTRNVIDSQMYVGQSHYADKSANFDTTIADTALVLETSDDSIVIYTNYIIMARGMHIMTLEKTFKAKKSAEYSFMESPVDDAGDTAILQGNYFFSDPNELKVVKRSIFSYSRHKEFEIITFTGKKISKK